MANDIFSMLVLAAGKSTRFKSSRSKLLHQLAGRPLGEYTLRAAFASGAQEVYMVVGHQAVEVQNAFERPGLSFIRQEEQLGTGHAVIIAMNALESSSSAHIVVMVGDAPLLLAETVRNLAETHSSRGAALTILTMELADPRGYGRIVRGRDRRVRKVAEEKLATPAERRIREVSSGILCFSRVKLLANIDRLGRDNAQNEYLLTDLVEILARGREPVETVLLSDPQEVLGVNDRVELARLERILRLRKAEALMRDGVTIINPEAAYIDDAVTVGQDTVIEPGVSLRGDTKIGRDCLIGPHSTLTDSSIGDRVLIRPCCVISGSSVASDAQLGPFAHLRDGALVESKSRVGNFVEVKKSRIGPGSKAGHLTYLGDAELGAGVNVGAGTVTCNYDGERKHATIIEDNVFIGSGSMLVAPLRVGKGSYVAAGSTITEQVPPDSLAIGRARQVIKPGWAQDRKAKEAAK